MQNLMDLFHEELKDVYDAEKQGLKALREMAEHVTDRSLKAAFKEHAEVTKNQVLRLEEVFGLIGEDARTKSCAGARGILKEHEQFMSEGPDAGVSNLYHVWAAAKFERYEITVYEMLVDLAERLGHSDAAKLLERTLEEEEDALETLLDLSEDVKLARAAAR